jgi:hypothetical protein
MRKKWDMEKIPFISREQLVNENNPISWFNYKIVIDFCLEHML